MEWYRSTEWSLDEQERFELKLRRARPENRGEYLRIKGLALESAGLIAAARALYVRAAVEAGRDEFTQSAALEHLADSLFDDDPAESERLLRKIIAVNPSLNGTSHMEEVHLAELLIRRGTAEGLAESLELLDSWDARGEGDFPAQLFEAAVARARWNDVAGETVAAAEWAGRALELAEAESPLTETPGLAVQDPDDVLVAWLTKLAERGTSARTRNGDPAISSVTGSVER
jgi:hypothetical protein